MRVRGMLAAAMAVVVVALALAPGAAQAVTCGAAAGGGGGETTRAVLTLDESSDTDATFKRDTGTRAINLIYRAADCTFSGTEPRPTVTILSAKDADELPPDAVTLMGTTFDRTEMTLRLQVDSATFDPGTYGGVVETRAPYLVTTRTPITASRSVDDMWVPIGVGALGGLVALLWFGLTKAATRNQLAIAPIWLFVVLAGGVVAGAFTVWSTYMSQNVWTLDENATSALLAAFTGATTGAMGTLLGALWASPAPTPPPPAAPAPALDPVGRAG
jgi:hypothetical protein